MRGFCATHEAGIIHRDIKQENLACATGELPESCDVLASRGLGAVPAFGLEVQQESEHFASLLALLLAEDRAQRASAKFAVKL